MKRFFIFLFIFCVVCGFISAQVVLRGKVYDNKTKKPIPRASVYLNGTSLHTVTDKEGEFVLGTGSLINTDLIISHIAYNFVSVPNPFIQNLDNIFLTEKDNSLKEIVVYADTRTTRDEKLTAFKKEFFGNTEAGRSCVIKNEHDIELYYNEKTMTLIASSDVPLIIENKFLGYEIQVNLTHFQAIYYPIEFMPPADPFGYSQYMNYIASRRFNEADLVSFESINLFTDIKPNDKKIKERRKKIYDYSYISFFKNLANSSLKQSDFTILNNRWEELSDKHFKITKESPYTRRITMIPNPGPDGGIEIQKGEDIGDRPSLGIINIVRRSQLSLLNFLTDTFVVDEYGNVEAKKDLIFSGVISKHRFGNMLPMDYKRGD